MEHLFYQLELIIVIVKLTVVHHSGNITCRSIIDIVLVPALTTGGPAGFEGPKKEEKNSISMQFLNKINNVYKREAKQERTFRKSSLLGILKV